MRTRASPMAMTVRSARSRAGSSSAKSPPLWRPPRITRQRAIEGLQAALRSGDVGRLRVVDERHATERSHVFQDMLGAAEVGHRGGDVCGAAPRMRAAVAAARRSCARWLPRSLSDERRNSCSSSARCLSRSRRGRPGTTRRRRRAAAACRVVKVTMRARPACAARSTAGSSAFTTAKSDGCWLAKMRALALGTRRSRGCWSRWSGVRFRNIASRGWKALGCLELEARGLDHEAACRRWSRR